MINNKSRHNLIDAKLQMEFRSTRRCLEFLGAAWSNANDVNSPRGDTKPQGGNKPYFFFVSLVNNRSKTDGANILLLFINFQFIDLQLFATPNVHCTLH